jgi:hypothetical protein
MKYPGHIKVTVIREVRSVEYARWKISYSGLFSFMNVKIILN